MLASVTGAPWFKSGVKRLVGRTRPNVLIENRSGQIRVRVSVGAHSRNSGRYAMGATSGEVQPQVRPAFGNVAR
jgi:hypothetical protein